MDILWPVGFAVSNTRVCNPKKQVFLFCFLDYFAQKMGCVLSNYFQSVCQARILPVITIFWVINLVYRLCLKQYCFLKTVSLPNVSVYTACLVFIMVAKRESACIVTRTPLAPCKTINTRYKWFI